MSPPPAEADYEYYAFSFRFMSISLAFSDKYKRNLWISYADKKSSIPVSLKRKLQFISIAKTSFAASKSKYINGIFKAAISPQWLLII